MQKVPFWIRVARIAALFDVYAHVTPQLTCRWSVSRACHLCAPTKKKKIKEIISHFYNSSLLATIACHRQNCLPVRNPRGSAEKCVRIKSSNYPPRVRGKAQAWGAEGTGERVTCRSAQAQSVFCRQEIGFKEVKQNPEDRGCHLARSSGV